MVTRVYLSLGSNLGDSRAILLSAIGAIGAHPNIFNLIHSSFHQTKPVSDLPQPDFLNCAVALDTTLSAHELLHVLQEIERAHGKVPKPKNAPRLLDIDIILFGDEAHATPELEIPHPRWRERPFVLLPLSEINPLIIS